MKMYLWTFVSNNSLYIQPEVTEPRETFYSLSGALKQVLCYICTPEVQTLGINDPFCLNIILSYWFKCNVCARMSPPEVTLAHSAPRTTLTHTHKLPRRKNKRRADLWCEFPAVWSTLKSAAQVARRAQRFGWSEDLIHLFIGSAALPRCCRLASEAPPPQTQCAGHELNG